MRHLHSLRRYWRAGSVFIRALLHPETPLSAKLILVAGLLYVAIPSDLLPDLLPLLGQLDDAIALIVAGTAFLKITQRVRSRMHDR